MAAIIRDDPEPLPPNVPELLRWVIERLLAKKPFDRCDSPRDLYRELKTLRDRMSQSTTGIHVAPATVRRRTSKRLGLVVVGAIACLAAGVGDARLIIPRSKL